MLSGLGGRLEAADPGLPLFAEGDGELPAEPGVLLAEPGALVQQAGSFGMCGFQAAKQ